MRHLLAVTARLVVTLLGSIAGCYANGSYFRDYADKVDHSAGFYFALFVPPLLISAAVGSVATMFLGPRRFLRNWSVLLLSTVLSYLTTMIVLWIGLQSMDTR